MSKIELLAPAGSMEGVRAAVQSGADAVYMGFGTFNARRGAKNFTREEMAEAISYCRIRGVKTNITFNIVAFDRERERAVEDIRFLNEAGADALIVQDLGLASLARAHAPDLELHASTQMTVHNTQGALFAKELGFSRVVLSRECSMKQIEEITAQSGVETEVFIHGALCMCYSGQCYMSGMVGGRSGNRGLCAQPCRLPYAYEEKGKAGYPLSLKDLSLAEWVLKLRDAGVSSLKIEGRMKRPEYAAVVTEIYAALLAENRMPTAQELAALQTVFSRDGFTDGYLTGEKGTEMFGVKTEVPLHEAKHLYEEAARRFASGKERPRVPLGIKLTVKPEGVSLHAQDADGNHAAIEDNTPLAQAEKRPLTREDAEKALAKMGGTPYFLQKLQTDIAPGLMVPASRLNALRRQALEEITRVRGCVPARVWMPDSPLVTNEGGGQFKGFTAQVRSLGQVTDALLESGIHTLYVPLTALAEAPARTEKLAAQIEVCAVLPRIYSDEEWKTLEKYLKDVCACGVQAVLCGSVGQTIAARALGLTVYGDFGLNITNGHALAVCKSSGISRQTLSFELRLAQIRDMAKPVATELLVYGYLPLMIFENCAIRRRTGKCTCEDKPCWLTDRTGRRFRLLPEYGCRGTLLNSAPLFLPKQAEYKACGAQYGRLYFTTESAAECAHIAREIAAGREPAFNEQPTRGLYYRGVE